jgi:hypothetical protein
VEEAGIGLQEAPDVRGREEVELIGLHPHEEIGTYACVVGSSLEAYPATSPGGSEVSAKCGGISHGSPSKP